MFTQVRRWIAVASAVAVLPAAAVAQDPVTITGHVTSDLGGPLSSANVTIAELNLNAYTNSDGAYRLVVPSGRVQGQEVRLTTRMLGYRAQSVSVRLVSGATVEHNFRLGADPLRLEEVVVTGAGTERIAERLGTARATVDASTIQRAAEPNVLQALAAKTAGLVTTQGGGEPGAGTALRLRGVSTITGSGQPSIIVDGVIINNTSRTASSSVLQGAVVSNRAYDLNPDDIESVEILKGSASSSVFGASAGAGGAILITTKRGAPGRTSVTLRSTVQFDEPIRTVPTQQRFGVGTGLRSTACTTENCFLASGFFSWGPELAAGTPVYDHAAEIFETGLMLDNALNVSGGSERTTFYLSASQLRHDGYIHGEADKFNRYTVRLSGTHRFIDNLHVGGSVAYAQTNGAGVGRGNSINGSLLGALRQPPEFDALQYLHPTTRLHRSWRFPNPGPFALVANRGFDNPFFAIAENPTTAETGRVFGNITTDWQPLEWLSLRHTLGVDYANDDRMEAAHVSASGAESGGSLTRRQFYDRILDHHLSATASFQLTPAVAAGLTVGQNLNETYFRQIFVTGRTLIAPTPFKLANTTTRDAPTDSEQRRRLEGYFAGGNLDLYDQVFLTLGIRNDGSSAFGTKRRAWYPRGSASWSFSRTLKLPETSPLTFGKLRAAYGESGQEPALYQLQDVFINDLLNDFNPGSQLHPTLGGRSGIYSDPVKGNPGLRPERVREWETGTDLSLFRGRADLSVTYYQKNAKDVIFSVPFAPSTGYSAQPQNAGEIENKGWEISLNGRPYTRPDVAVQIGANWSRNRNKVLALGDATIIGYSSSFVGSTTHAIVGQPLGVFQGLDFARCGRGLTTIGANDIAAACAGQPDGALYISASGLPIQDPNTRIIGDPNPDWTAGLNFELHVRGVRLSAFLEHRQGGQVLNMTRSSMLQYGTHKDTEIRSQVVTFGQNFFAGETVVGPGANQPVNFAELVGTPPNQVTRGEQWFSGLGGVGGPRAPFMEDATHTRLREVSLAYTFNQEWVRKIGFRSIDLRVSGRNLKLWTDYTGFDPETTLGGSLVANRGIDWFVNPLPRAWVISTSFTY